DHGAGTAGAGGLVPPEVLEGARGRGERREVHPVPQQPLRMLLPPASENSCGSAPVRATSRRRAPARALTTGSVRASASAASYPPERIARTRPPRRNTPDQPTETDGALPADASSPISAAIRLASASRVSTMSSSGTVLMTSPLTKIWP